MADIRTILGIETSCDETAAAVVRDGKEVLSNVVATQVDLHRKYGGVVPEIASRAHLEQIDAIIQEALDQAGCTLDDLDAIKFPLLHSMTHWLAREPKDQLNRLVGESLNACPVLVDRHHR